MRITRILSPGSGVILLLLSFSILSAFRLASIGTETISVTDDSAQAFSGGTEDVVALIRPSADDYVSRAIDDALALQDNSGEAPYRVFSPTLPPFLAESEAMLNTLDIAREAGVQAIVVRPDTIRALERAVQIAATGLPTVAVGALLPEADVHVRVGVDPVELGRTIASVIGRHATPDSRVGYLCGLCSGAEAASAQRLLESVELGRGTLVQSVDDVELGSIAAAGALLRRDVDIVFCDTAEATIAMAQVLIDSNRVGEIQIVGYGTTDRVLSLVDDRVVDATIGTSLDDAVAAAIGVVGRAVTERGDQSASIDRRLAFSPNLEVIGPEDDTS